VQLYLKKGEFLKVNDLSRQGHTLKLRIFFESFDAGKSS